MEVSTQRQDPSKDPSQGSSVNKPAEPETPDARVNQLFKDAIRDLEALKRRKPGGRDGTT